jgi:hypothetical protein
MSCARPPALHVRMHAGAHGGWEGVSRSPYAPAPLDHWSRGRQRCRARGRPAEEPRETRAAEVGALDH